MIFFNMVARFACKSRCNDFLYYFILWELLNAKYVKIYMADLPYIKMILVPECMYGCVTRAPSPRILQQFTVYECQAPYLFIYMINA